MAHKCFVSFKYEDIDYKNYIRDNMKVEIIDRSLTQPIDSFNEEYILRKIREDYLADSTVTIFLIGTYSSETRGSYEQRFIKKELQASLYNGSVNSRNGILGIVLPQMVDSIYKGSYNCNECGGVHKTVSVNDYTVIKEFSYNYYIPIDGKCSWSEDDRYCVLTTWEDFIKYPELYVDMAFNKRSHPISNKVKVRP